MPIVLGALAGAFGFAPIFLSMRLSRRSASQAALTIGLYGLVPFVVAEGIVFLGATLAYVVYKNVLAKRRTRRGE